MLDQAKSQTNRLARLSQGIYLGVMTTLDQVERLALELPETDRAKLASHLLESLPPGLDEEDDGISEAIRRDCELDTDPGRGISLKEFDAHIKQRRSR